MNLTRNRIRSIGWVFVLSVCLAFTAALTLRVNAVKGQVRQSENRIVALKREVQYLEVEFQTRANQQKLAALNSVEFGYVAPSARQYLEGERQLAGLGVPRAPGAPKPIRMAQAVTSTEAMPFIAMVSPVAGNPAGDKADSAKPARSDSGPQKLAQSSERASASGDLISIAIAEAGSAAD
jgi:hypothetical protein